MQGSLTRKGSKAKILIFCSLPENSGSYTMGKYMARAMSKYLKVNYIKSHKRLPFNLYYLASIPIYAIKSIFQKSDYTLVLKPFPAACIAAMIQKLYGSKIILDIDDIDYGYTKSISRITKIVQSFFVSKFDIVFVHNKELMKRVQKDFNIKKEKLYLRDQGVDLDIFNPRCTIKKNPIKTLIYTGYLNASSYLGEIIKAFKLASLKKSNIRLLVVGDGYKKDSYQNMARKLGINAEFLGFVSNQYKVADLISSSDACVVYYPANLGNKYRCSMKVREYLAMGKPAACNDFGDLARFKKYTYMARTGDMEDFSRQILKALFEPDKRELLGTNYVRKNLSWDSVIKGMLEKIKHA